MCKNIRDFLIFPEEVGVGAGVNHKHDEFVIMFLPDKEPVGFQVAFQAAFVFTGEFVCLVPCGKFAFFFEDLHRLFDDFHVIASLGAQIERLVEFPGVRDFIYLLRVS